MARKHIRENRTNIRFCCTFLLNSGIMIVYFSYMKSEWKAADSVITVRGWSKGQHTYNYHLKKIFLDGELEEQSVIRKFRITASDGKSYNTNHYNLKAIIAVGNKVDSPRAVQFRKWANGIIEEYSILGVAI